MYTYAQSMFKSISLIFEMYTPEFIKCKWTSVPLNVGTDKLLTHSIMETYLEFCRILFVSNLKQNQKTFKKFKKATYIYY